MSRSSTSAPSPPPPPAPLDDRGHRALASATRLLLLQTLRSDGPAEADHLGRRVGLHRNTVRAHLAVLREAGLVESRPLQATGPGRPRVAFAATGASPEGQEAAAYRLLAGILAGSLEGRADGRTQAIEAGRAAGRELAGRDGLTPAGGDSRDELLALLATLGFAPQRSAAARGGSEVIELRSCPFHDLAGGRSAIVCAVHQGLLEGIAATGGSRVRVRLLPMVAPERCEVRLDR